MLSLRHALFKRYFSYDREMVRKIDPVCLLVKNVIRRRREFPVMENKVDRRIVFLFVAVTVVGIRVFAYGGVVFSVGKALGYKGIRLFPFAEIEVAQKYCGNFLLAHPRYNKARAFDSGGFILRNCIIFFTVYTLIDFLNISFRKHMVFVGNGSN